MSEKPKDSSEILSAIKNEVGKLMAGDTPSYTRSRVRKWLSELQLGSIGEKGIAQVVSTWVATPLGSAVIATVAVILLHKAGFFKGFEGTLAVDAILTVIWSGEVLSALGGAQGIVSAVGGLASIMGGVE
ncbi:MAG: hypothetical protein QW429_05600 [Thermoprotei archaeon]